MPYPKEILDRITPYLDDDPASCLSEVAICRCLVAEAVKNNQPALANSLLVTLSKLSSTHISNEIRAGQLLNINELASLGHEMSTSILEALSFLPPDQLSTIVERIIPAMGKAIVNVRNKTLAIEVKHEQA